ncbi:spore germination protein [Neobacillus fumarioli]|uniref:spore germination protein n=1 Tax=Neobacillus fumarioli TaxID=105229 RepID=UPI000830EF51|nr:spore germination protein [Neobacillus fumarioli]
MPAIINGPLQIATVGGSGVVNFGGTAVLSPKYVSKTYGGSGGFSVAGAVITANGLSGTNVVDPSLVDQPTVGNN